MNAARTLASAASAALPFGWRWATLGELGTYINGRAFKPHDWGTSGLPIIRIQNLNTPDAPLDRYEGPIDDRHLIADGDLLISWSASLDAYIWERGPAALNQHIFRVVVNKELVTRDYLFYAVKYAMTGIRKRVHGATMQHVTKPEFVATRIPLPPLPEQQRIAAMLHEQLNAAARMRAASARQHAVARRLRAARVSQLLTEAQSDAWAEMKLGDIATQVQNGVYKPSQFYRAGFSLLRMYNLRNDEPSLDLSEMAHVTLDSEEYRRYRLRAGNLLISRVNSFERVGKCALVDPDVEGFVFENMLLRVGLTESVVPAFVAEQLMTRDVQAWIRGVARRAIGQSSINSRDVRAIPLRIPPIDEQQSIVARMRQLAGTVRGATAVAASLSDAADALPSAILRRAFTRETR